MAKKNAGRLAGLAALGAATYLINEKLSKGKGKSDDAGDQITSNYTKKDKKVENHLTEKRRNLLKRSNCQNIFFPILF